MVVRSANIDRDLEVFWPACLSRGDGVADLSGCVDQIEPAPFDHLKRDGVGAVVARSRGLFLEGQADRRKIAQRDDAVAIGLDRQGIDVLRLVKGGGDLDGECALRGVDLAGSNQEVVLADHIDQLTRRNVIGFESQRVDFNEQHLVALAGQLGVQNRVEALDFILKFLGDTDQGAFGHLSSQVDNNHREFGEVDLVDRILVGALWKLCLGGIHRVAHIGHHAGLVPAIVE